MKNKETNFLKETESVTKKHSFDILYHFIMYSIQYDFYNMFGIDDYNPDVVKNYSVGLIKKYINSEKLVLRKTISSDVHQVFTQYLLSIGFDYSESPNIMIETSYDYDIHKEDSDFEVDESPYKENKNSFNKDLKKLNIILNNILGDISSYYIKKYLKSKKNIIQIKQ